MKDKTRDFPDNDTLVNFMKLHLHDLYDAYAEAEQENDYSLMDYVQGSIDTTHVYLIKSGAQYKEYEDYLELVNLEWKKA